LRRARSVDGLPGTKFGVRFVLNGESDRRPPVLEARFLTVCVRPYRLLELPVGLCHHVSPYRLDGRQRAARSHRVRLASFGAESMSPSLLLPLLLEVSPLVDYLLAYGPTGDR